MIEIDSVPLSRVTGGWSAFIGNRDTPECQAARAHVDETNRAVERDLGNPQEADRAYEQRGEAAKAAVDACGGTFTPSQPASWFRSR